jgi:methionyl-tRNA formyltransferase
MRRNIIFFGSSPFSIDSLVAIAKEHDIKIIITKPDVRAKRGKKFVENVVAVKGKELGIKHILKYSSLSSDEVQSEILSMIDREGVDIGIVVAYGNIIPRRIFDNIKDGVYNLHASLLPKYRGASPIRCALLNGDRETGVSIQKIVEKLDAGDIYLMRKERIYEEDNYITLSKRLSLIGADLLLEFLRKDVREYIPIKQDESLASYCGKVNKDELVARANISASLFHNRVRAYVDLGVYTFFRGKRIKILKTKIIDKEKRHSDSEVGRVIGISKDNGILVAFLEGIIGIYEVQVEGKTPISFLDFINGYRIKVGERFINGREDS